MPRYRDALTGSTVNIPESLAAELGGQYRPVETKKAPKKPAKPKKSEQ